MEDAAPPLVTAETTNERHLLAHSMTSSQLLRVRKRCIGIVKWKIEEENVYPVSRLHDRIEWSFQPLQVQELRKTTASSFPSNEMADVKSSI